jgi:hypothetical protein
LAAALENAKMASPEAGHQRRLPAEVAEDVKNGAPWSTDETVGSPATSDAIEPGKAFAGNTFPFLVGHRLASSIRFTSDVDMALGPTPTWKS